MSDLLWPGDHRAGDAFSDTDFLAAMLTVEAVWSAALVAAGIAPSSAEVSTQLLQTTISTDDLDRITVDGEAGGNPVIPLIQTVRERLENPEAAQWIHRGLTSQDVLDTALMLCAKRTTRQIAEQLNTQAARLSSLADTHRATLMTGRTLTQHAVPVTFGLKCAIWLKGILNASDRLRSLSFPAQFGGAAGTMAAAVVLAHGASPFPRRATLTAISHATELLQLCTDTPWHTVRTPVTRCGDAATECSAAFGHIANDVATLSRPEIAELAEGAAGGSSTMPHKANPVLSVLIRRTALSNPGLAATLHVAAADSLEERSAGSWHAEWATLRTLLRQTLVAARQTTVLIEGLAVDADRIAANYAAAHWAMRSEHESMAELTGNIAEGSYLGLTDHFIQTQIDRVRNEGSADS